MSLEPGRAFGRYEIAELLGEGGMGQVYRAHDTLLNRRVALKVLRPSTERAEGTSAADDADRAARILREARAAAGIDHPNAVAIYDVGEIEGVPFLAMELVSGRSLRAFERDATISLERRIRWLLEVARALGAAHRLGVVHRDIKPENVMVRDDGAVKVLDFGIARFTTPALAPDAPTQPAQAGAPHASGLTARGFIVGTPVYMAPEQMRGERLDGRADQFSWGVVAYELLTGSLPWNIDEGGARLVDQVLSREVEAPRSRNPEIPAAVDAILRRALGKSPGARFASMDLLGDALEPHAQTGGTPVAPGKSSSDPPLAELALAKTERTKRASPPPAAPPRHASERLWPLVAACFLAVALAAGAALSRAWLASRHGAAVAPADAGISGAEADLSANPEATAAYRAGMRALRDACPEAAVTQLDRAIALDHWFAAAHLGRAAYESVSDFPNVTTFQENLRDARISRAALGPREKALLDALEPWALVPPDLAESKRRLEAATHEYPADALFAFELGIVLHRTGATVEAARAFEAVLAEDPSFAAALGMIARERVGASDVAGAMEADRKCLEVSSGATECLRDLAELEANEGKCAELATTSRRMSALAPDSSYAFHLLAGALAGTGERPDGVRQAFEQAWARIPAETRRSQELADEAALAVLSGELAHALDLYRDYEREVASSPDEMVHFIGFYGRMLVSEEMGRGADVLRIADEYLHRRAAWKPNSFGLDPTMWIYAREVAAGGITRTTLDALRARWNPGAGVDADYAWAIAWATPAFTETDATRAMAARPEERPVIDALAMTPDVGEAIGRLYLLAGQLDEAVPVLEKTSRSCSLLRPSQTTFVLRASLELGEALEARHEVARACEAYERVLARWGSATPASRTAADARRRAERLGCRVSEAQPLR